MARTHATGEQREHVRNQIRAAAATIFKAEGLAGISVRSIASAAGVSVGTVYSYFGNLQDLMQSLWREPISRFEQTLEKITAKHPDPLNRIEALLRAYLAFGLKNPDLYRGAFLFVRPTTFEVPPRETLGTAKFARFMIEAITEGQQSGAIISGRPPELAQLLWSGLHGSLSLPVNLDRIAFRSTRTVGHAMIEAMINHLSVDPKKRGA
ncbi:MAG: TetR/AcrR family transcriptional regulator [Pseudomonadota bacterium]